VLRLDDHRSDYPRSARLRRHLLADGSLQDIVAASYSRLIVDEYQDCSVRQHQLLELVSEALPTCVLGDPMQAIFDFGARSVCQTGTPKSAGRSLWLGPSTSMEDQCGTEGLGRWLSPPEAISSRGRPIDLGGAPDESVGSSSTGPRITEAARRGTDATHQAVWVRCSLWGQLEPGWPNVSSRVRLRARLW